MRVTSCFCDSSVRLSHVGIWQLMEDSVTEYMHSLDMDGLVTIKRHNAMWVYTTARTRILRRPGWLEEFTVRSFLSGKEKVRIRIDTVFEDAAGREIIRGQTELCAVDLAEKRIRRVDSVCPDEIVPEEPAGSFERIRYPKEGFAPGGSLTVRYTNIDYLHHVNNIEYLRFILDTYTVRHLEERELREIALEYRGQSYEGDVLTLGSLQAPEGQFYEIRRGAELVTRAFVALA